MDFDCIKAYLNSGRVEQISNELYLDPNVVLRFVQSYAEHMDFPKRKWENYTDEDPEEEVIVETLEVETSVLPMEEDYEPEPVLPYQVRKAQLEYFSREHSEDENENKSKAMVKPQKRRKQEKPIETMEEEVTCFVKGCIKAADTGKPIVPCSFGSTFYFWSM